MLKENSNLNILFKGVSYFFFVRFWKREKQNIKISNKQNKLQFFFKKNFFILFLSILIIIYTQVDESLINFNEIVLQDKSLIEVISAQIFYFFVFLGSVFYKPLLLLIQQSAIFFIFFIDSIIKSCILLKIYFINLFYCKIIKIKLYSYLTHCFNDCWKSRDYGFQINFFKDDKNIFFINKGEEGEVLLDFCNKDMYDFYTYFFNDFILFKIQESIEIVCNNFLNWPIFILFAIFFLFTSFFSFLALSYLGFYGVFFLNFCALFLLWFSFLLYIPAIVKANTYYYVSFGKWIYLNTNYRVNFDFLIDTISVSFSFLTLTIAIFVYLYTFAYFRYEPLVDRLLILLNLFIISMVLLVSSGNFIMLFLGWELIGLTSFFLINFWVTRVGTLKAAFKAFSFNKVSDLLLFFAILLIFNTTYNLDIAAFLLQIPYYKTYEVSFFFLSCNLLDVISLLFLGCAFIKSAQIGAHIWLPDSMEAPVPASALIHSATLVSAGIYLLLRLSVLFELSNYAYTIIGVVGSLTAFYGGAVAMYQSDTKKILAYSTISHCGFLMVTFTTGIIEYTLLYLYLHGFFKALIFMSVGNINRFSRNNQDYKKMGGYYKYLPFDCFVCFIGLINLSGFPFTLGFFIKHLLFLGVSGEINVINYFILINCLFGAFTGLFYSYRLFYNVFFDFKKGKKQLYKQASEKQLNSKFYSNTSLLGNLAIVGLLVTTYIISLFLFNSYSTIDYNFSDLNSFFFSSTAFDNFFPSKNFLYNVSYLNYFVLILMAALVFTPWRALSGSINQRVSYLRSFFFLILFIFFFSIFFNIL